MKGIDYEAGKWAPEFITGCDNSDRVNGPNKRIEAQKIRFSNALSDASWKNAIASRAGIHDEKFPRPVHVVLVHTRVARFDGLLYAITLPGSQSASLSVRFKMGGRPSTP